MYQMVWYFYGTILVCSFINWGNIATVYNIKNEKADFKFLYSLNYNNKILQEKFPKEMAEKANYEKELKRLFIKNSLLRNFRFLEF